METKSWHIVWYDTGGHNNSLLKVDPKGYPTQEEGMAAVRDMLGQLFIDFESADPWLKEQMKNQIECVPNIELR